MAEVEAHVSNALDKYEPREITTVLYAMAKLHHRCKKCGECGDTAGTHAVCRLFCMSRTTFAPSMPALVVPMYHTTC